MGYYRNPRFLLSHSKKKIRCDVEQNPWTVFWILPLGALRKEKWLLNENDRKDFSCLENQRQNGARVAATEMRSRSNVVLPGILIMMITMLKEKKNVATDTRIMIRIMFRQIYICCCFHPSEAETNILFMRTNDEC